MHLSLLSGKLFSHEVSEENQFLCACGVPLHGVCGVWTVIELNQPFEMVSFSLLSCPSIDRDENPIVCVRTELLKFKEFSSRSLGFNFHLLIT